MIETLKEKIKIHLLTPQQLLDKYEKNLYYLSCKYARKGLEKDEAYNQAYLELLEIYLQTPEITDFKPIRKASDKLRNYYRKELKYWNNNISLDALLDKNSNFLEEREKQNAKEYSKNYYPKIPIDILDLREQKIIKMYYFLGYKEKEIANYFNLSHQRVNKIKSTALKKMKNALLEN